MGRGGKGEETPRRAGRMREEKLRRQRGNVKRQRSKLKIN